MKSLNWERFFTESDSRLIYPDPHSVNDDQTANHGANRESDQMGYAFRDRETGWRETGWHIEFPAPDPQSMFDAPEFRRTP